MPHPTNKQIELLPSDDLFWPEFHRRLALVESNVASLDQKAKPKTKKKNTSTNSKAA